MSLIYLRLRIYKNRIGISNPYKIEARKSNTILLKDSLPLKTNAQNLKELERSYYRQDHYTNHQNCRYFVRPPKKKTAFFITIFSEIFVPSHSHKMVNS